MKNKWKKAIKMLFVSFVTALVLSGLEKTAGNVQAADDVIVEVASIEGLRDAVNMANSDPNYRIVANLTHNISGISRGFVLNESKLVIVLNGYTISGTVSGDNNRPGYIFKSVGADLTI